MNRRTRKQAVVEKEPMWAFLNRYLTQPGDDPQVVFHKKILLAISLAAAAIYSWIALTNSNGTGLAYYKGWMGALSGLIAAFQLLYERKIRHAVTELTMYGYVVAIIITDYTGVVEGNILMWSGLVLVLDVALVCRLKRRVTINVIVIGFVWLVIVAIETTLRIGVYDAPFLPSQAERFRRTCDCTSLPCPRDFNNTFAYLLAQIVIFLLDFYFTRGFSSRLYQETDKMHNVISTAETTAEALSRFDLALAEEAINSSPLPPPLHDAFSSIISNLRVYRPYIPDALFDHLHGTAEQPREVPAPGLMTDVVAIVFTDIQGSTATWEACPEGMKESLKVHDHVMRECLHNQGGYEVKTIGDAFMVAFASAVDAVDFSLNVQEKLVQSKWPQELLCLDHCAWQEDGPWCGLRVRIGVHWGEVEMQLNTLTGRYDYFGNTVNKAARMEGTCIGGAVAITEEVMAKVGPLEGVCVIVMGDVKLRGVPGYMHPFLLLPQSLAGRSQYCESQLRLKREDRKITVHNSTGVSLRDTISVNAETVLSSVASASVGILNVKLPDTRDHREATLVMNDALAKVNMCSERTHGVVVSLQGSRVAVGWNTSRPCVTHVENSVAFVSMLHRLLEQDDCTAHLGVSASDVRHGTVGNQRQRFVAVLGQCVDVSGVLATLAEQVDVFALYGSHSEPRSIKGTSFALEEHSPQGSHGLNAYRLVVRAWNVTEATEHSLSVTVV